MATVKLIEYEEAVPEVRAVYDDIMATRQIDWINNFWKAIAVQPELLRRTWQGVKAVTAPGALDAVVKEMLYGAISVTNGCKYCINSHTAAARKKGLTDEMLAELMAVVGMAKTLSNEVAADGVLVNTVCPGFIETEMTQKLDEKTVQGWRDAIPLKRGGTPEDVANACLFLASDLSSYITGQVLNVDGGMLT